MKSSGKKRQNYLYPRIHKSSLATTTRSLENAELTQYEVVAKEHLRLLRLLPGNVVVLPSNGDRLSKPVCFDHVRLVSSTVA